LKSCLNGEIMPDGRGCRQRREPDEWVTRLDYGQYPSYNAIRSAENYEQ
jgi:hypothetical protein